MENLTEEQRLDKIKAITAEITALNQQLIFDTADANALVVHGNYALTLERDEKSVAIDRQIWAKVTELHQYQMLYFVDYVAEEIHYNNQSLYETRRQYIYLNGNYDLDTLENGLEHYKNSDDMRNFLNELTSHILTQEHIVGFRLRAVKKVTHK